MGVSIREKEKGSGVWWIFIRHNNQRKAKKIGAKALAQKAKTIMEARLIANDLGFFDEITRMDVKRFLLKKLSSGLSKSSVNYMKNALSGIFYVAIDSEIIQYNPTSGLRLKLTSRNSKPPVVPLNKQELNLLLNTFREHRPAHTTLLHYYLHEPV